MRVYIFRAKMKEKTTTDRNNTTTDAVRVEFNKETTPKTLASDGELATLLDFLDMVRFDELRVECIERSLSR